MMMDDLDKFIKAQKKTDPDFAKNFDEGYKLFKIGVMLKQARKEASVTQEELAQKLNTKKSAISRKENNAEDIRRSNQHKYAGACGNSLHVCIR